MPWGTLSSPSVPHNFLGLEPRRSSLRASRFVVLPVPYDSTTSYKSGTREGPSAIIAASRHMEEYDPELQDEPCRHGIHTLAELEPHTGDPAVMVERVATAVRRLARRGKCVVMLGGEHSITVGGVKGFLPTSPDLAVLYLDAHADLRDEYLGTRYNHGCGARRIAELCPLVQVGIRSMSREEAHYVAERKIPIIPWDAATPAVEAIPQVLAALPGPDVYVSIDLDVLDPSLMAAVGTPEPGGMGWQGLLALMRAVSRARRIVGFDLCELCPGEGPVACAYTAATLAYKLMGYVASNGELSGGGSPAQQRRA
ncbi:MAG: agmatinase [Chloroflexi bacterium]|nr:agmatinase [Chloroflexota bacterium]